MLSLLLLSGCSSKFFTRSEKPEKEAQPEFIVEHMNVVSDDDSLWIMPHSLSVKLYHDGIVGDVVNIRDTLRVKSYEETLSSDLFGSQLAEFFGTPFSGYALDVELTNDATQKFNRQSYYNVGIRYIPLNTFALSDPIITSVIMINEVDGSINILPANSKSVDPWQEINFLVVVYYPKEELPVQINLHYFVLDTSSGTVVTGQDILQMEENDWAPGIIKFHLPETASNGNYQLLVFAKDERGNTTGHVNKSFFVNSIIPRTPKELDEAASQMKYVASKGLIKSIHQAKTSEEKANIFLGFWKNKYCL